MNWYTQSINNNNNNSNILDINGVTRISGKWSSFVERRVGFPLLNLSHFS